ncbi:methylcrotonoyl-CoA carboxylase subunit alpha [Musa troglodytarum]|uniref:Methylcrotonoyl-CoA carboxylase subunit alpha n=1 Tax=Musa troglodytarum TaxID=320322 RepID=A0A9E7FJX5_9LILI|nr:methylcrotonoyl-CoA carboxylase subunit alpha [Musa troglodytarum]
MALMSLIIRRKFPVRTPIGNANPSFSILRLFSSSPPASAAAGDDRGIEKILVANRGEIACRVMRTAGRLGIGTVAVYSDADSAALHVKSADEAVRIGPPPARASYLNASAIIEAALRTGAQAIHPGYGFLSESADFAQLCETEGLIFIGPPASAIRDMGDKSASKRIMGAAGVPLVPGYHGDNQDINFLKLEAEKIGYPILIKPTHGGGGKFYYMKLVYNLVFGDKHGNVIHLNERDCSVQRRHQKIIEEAPAPNITNEFRSHLGKAAVSAAKAVGYYSAGTVEFIMDTVSGEFYFMEMNTRLQVEHPVTEMIVGQDLVEWQIRVANGEHLPLVQEQVPLNGHSFEARIYAENVPKGFLPATGTLHHYRPVPVSPTVRVETGVEEGNTVSMHYDPMIAKLVVWGENRHAALGKLKNCLTNFQVAGLPTNIAFLHMLSNHWAFDKGRVETHFIEHFKTDFFPDEVSVETDVAAKLSATIVAACICEMDYTTSRNTIPITGGNSLLPLWYSQPPFRMHHAAKRMIELEWDKELTGSFPMTLKLVITYQPEGGYFIEIGDSDSPGMEVKIMHAGDRDYKVDVNGLQSNVTLTIYSKERSKHIQVWHGKHHYHFRQTVRLEQYNDDGLEHKKDFQARSHPEGSVLAPMAGLVVKVVLENGSFVDEGQPVLVLEAMKMEHVVKSPRAGYVNGLQVAAGQQVFDTTVLFNIKDK